VVLIGTRSSKSKKMKHICRIFRVCATWSERRHTTASMCFPEDHSRVCNTINLYYQRTMSAQKPCLTVSPRKKREGGTDGATRGDDQQQHETTFDDLASMDAASYLSRVREQARRLPEVFESEPAAPKPKRPKQEGNDHVITGSAASLHFLVSSPKTQAPPSSQHVPAGGVQWVEQTLANFSQLRLYLEQCQNQGVGRDKSNRVPVPTMKDRVGWYTFCVGSDAAAGNVGGYYDDDDGNNEATDRDIPAWKQKLPSNGHAATTGLLLQLDQVMVRRILGHLTYYCETSNTNIILPQHASWLYALMARLERPIHRDDAVSLYSLLKSLTSKRANIAAANRNEIATLNVLIAVVGIYFEQGGGYANVMEVK